MEEIKTLLDGIIERQDLFAMQMEQVLEKLCQNQVSCKNSEDKFLCCAKGFQQVKEATECLLDQLDSYGGVITENTWNDGC